MMPEKFEERKFNSEYYIFFFENHMLFALKAQLYSYDMKVVTKEWSIAEKIFHLSWESNPVLPVKNPTL